MHIHVSRLSKCITLHSVVFLYGLYTIVFTDMTEKLKFWSGGSSSLWFAMQAEKGLPKSATKFASAKSNGN